ncbi:MAG: hypothetical protein QOE95_2258 [Gaiellaceae bacterium]|jgi:hypothetical protein|nr:hypothetical protein [Gaiellaceae bacterium]
MRRSVFIGVMLALAEVAVLTYGSCKATDTAGDMGVGSKPAAKPAASAPSGTTEVHADGVRRVTVAELQSMLAEGRAVVYDTRAKMAYDAEHLQGSLSMPYDEVMKRAGELPQGKTLVFYCT